MTKAATRALTTLFCALVLQSLAPGIARATSAKDVKIGLHVVDFLKEPAPKSNSVGIAYDPRDKESTADAEAIFGVVASSVSQGIVLKPFLIDSDNLAAAKPMRALFVADRMRAHYDALAEFSRKTGTLLISTDLDCARSGRCTIGIASEPRVEVIFSSEQAQAGDIQFTEAFKMMVTGH